MEADTPGKVAPKPEKPEKESPEAKKGGMGLLQLVIIGLIGSAVVVALLGWYFSQQEFLHACNEKCQDWKIFPPLGQDQMFSVLRNSVTTAAALGLGVTIMLSYRKQRVAEKTLEYTAETQRLAVNAQNLAAEAQKLAVQRLDRESLDILRQRYLVIAELLNKQTEFAPITALHALESLVTSWRQLDNDREATASIGLLMSAMRLSSLDLRDSAREFRQTTLRSLSRHMSEKDDTEQHWGSLNIDATACLQSGGLDNWRISGGEITASLMIPQPLLVRNLVIESGTVRCDVSDAIESKQIERASFNAMKILDGRLQVHFTKVGSTGVNFRATRSKLRGGIIQVRTSARPLSEIGVDFDNCSFEGTRLVGIYDRETTVTFTRCRFLKPFISPMMLRVLKRRKNAYSTIFFDSCIFVDGDGAEAPIASLDDYERCFGGPASGNTDHV